MTQRTLGEFLGAYQAPRISVRITTRADLLATVERLAARIEALPRSEALNSERSKLQAELEAAVAMVRGSEFEFEFQALSHGEYDRLVAACPPRPSQAELGLKWDPDRFPYELIARCAINPTLTVEQVTELCDTLSDSQFQKLWTCAAAVNIGDDSAPKVVTSSATEDPDET